MNCVIPGRGIRAFGKAIQCLAKIGDELYIEALRKGLALKTVNAARSAFASFLFCRRFFNSYSDGLRSGNVGEGEGEEGEGGEEEEEWGEEGSEDTIKCKITIKSCLTVFRALSSLEKTVDYFTLTLNLKLSKLVFIFHCRHGIVKTHNLGFQECEALQAVFSKGLCPNHIKVQSRVLSEVVLNFPSFLEEVTMTADPESVRLQNYTEVDSVDTRSTLTEVRLMPAEFDDYQIGVDTSITFCLKELRAVLLFTDAFPHSLSLRFESAGRPVVFSIDDGSDFKVDFVLATLLDPTSGTTATSSHQTHRPPSTNTHASVRRRETSSNSTHLQKKAMQNGRTHDRTNEEGNTHHHDEAAEDEWSHPFSRAESSRVRRRRREGRDGQTSTRGEPNTHQSTENSSNHQISATGGSGGGGSQLASTSSHSSSLSRAPPPGGAGGDVMVMVTEGVGEKGREGDVCGERGSVGGSDSGGGGGFVDPLDALFGEENMMDVGEGGWEGGGFGMEPQADTTATHRETQHSPSVSDQPSSRSPHPHPSPAPLATSLTPPHSPYHTSHHPPLSPARGDGWGEGREGGGATTLTQDSILQDSGFLPGTPPAKKFKTSSSLLFRVGLFSSDLRTPGQSAILAPDSEEDSD